MEDYDVFNEMNNIGKIIIVIEDDEKFIKELINSNIEIIPIRFRYDLSSFTSDYIDKTKKLFIYYYNEENNCQNELLRIKKHFIHYQRYPFAAYVPNDIKYLKLKQILKELNIMIISNKQSLLNYILEKK